MAVNYWSKNELILVLNIYLQLRPEEINLQNIKIISLGKLINRSPNSIITLLKSFLYCSLENEEVDTAENNLYNAYCRPIWKEYGNDPQLLEEEVHAILKKVYKNQSFFPDNLTKVVPVEKILEIIIKSLEKTYLVNFSGDNPYLVWLDSQPYYVFVRNLTRAYADHAPEVCRIQLHKSKRFEEVINSPIPLLVLGYCELYKTFCTWPIEDIKPRLNEKRNVSLYSRFYEQIPVCENTVRKFKLNTGQEVTVVDEQYVDLLFAQTIEETTGKTNQTGIPVSFNEDELYSLLKSTLDDEVELNAINICINYFEKLQLDYTLLQIKNLIKKYKIKYSIEK